MDILKLNRSIMLALCFTVLLVAGCTVDANAEKKPNPDINPELYRCDAAQLELVKKEFEICSQTGYFDSYCFSQAKKSQCELIDSPIVLGN